MKFTSKIATYVDLLRERADQQSDRLAYTFLPDGEGEGVSLSFAQLDERARAIGAYLREQCDPGDRVLVLLPSGLAYLCAFWGCLYAGVVAVPAYPPGNKRHLPRLASVINDAGAKLVLSEVSIEEMVRAMGEVGDAFDQLQWCAYESVTDEWAEHWTPPDIGPSTLAYLQYTSGSTSAPKGVMLTHANVLCNQKVIEAGCHHDQNSTYVSWLPLFHDMGLVSALQATYLGARFVFMSPTAFIQRPLRWLQAIDRFSAHTSGGPNFAYEHCVGRIDEEQCQGLDLSSWRIAFNGAEPVQWKTIEQFQQKFARFGFRQDAFYPCYGLAEATVAVTGGERGRGPVVEVVDGESLRTGKVRRVSEDELGARHIVGCGYPWMGEEVVIVDPDSEQVCAEDEIGEVWVKGGSVGRGYWNNAQESERVFGAYLGRKGPYLRTGDLGFVTAGELYIAGRAKDMIVIRGRNYFPQDIEQSVQQCHAALQRQVGAAFAIEVDGHEQLVIAQEVERSHWRKVDKEELAGIVCSVIGEEFELTVHALALLKPGRIPKTSSGKVQRQACKEAFLQGQLEATETKVSHAYVAPQNPLQTALCSIWVKVIGVEQVGIEDNFFALGGDSIKAVRVANQLQQTLGATVYVVSIFEAPTVQALAAYLHREYAPEIMQVFPQLIGPGDETAQGDGPESSSAPRQPETMLPPLLPVAREQPLPLSFSQQRLWFLDQLDPGNPVYNIPAAMRMSGLLDMQALESCFEAIVARHEILRTRFAVVGTDPVQAIDPHAELVIEKHDFSQLEGSEQTQAVMGYIEEQARRGFRLDTDMLIRVSVLRLANDEHVLMVNMHHIVCDGWSIGVMVQELGMLYSSKVKAQDGVLPALPIQYGDYAVWQRGWLVGDELERQLNYWENQLRGAPVVLGIPTDRPRPPIKSYRGRHFTFKFSEFVTRKLRVFAQSQGVTLYVLLLTGYQLMLSRYARENDICVGTAVAGRSHAEVEGLIGFFVNALVMRTDVSGDPSVAQLLERVRDVVLGAFAHEAVPAELVVERLGVERNLSHAPLAQVALTLQNAPVGVVEVPGVRFEPISFETCTAQYDLMVLMEEVNNELIGTVEYSTDLFDESTVAQMMGHMENLLRGMVIDPERRLSDVSMLGTNELYELLNLPQQSYEQIWPLTTTQRDLYLHSVMVPDTVLNSMGVVLKLDATTDLVQWRAALETLYEQDPVLRAEIVSANIPFLDAAYLAIPCSPKTHFEVLDLRAEKLTQAQLKQRVDELVYAPYEIAKPPLIRHYVLQIDDENIYAVFAGHHIVMDGISGGLVVLHAYNIYQALGKGKTYSDCPPPVFERYQQEHNRQFDTPKVQEYWQQKLQNVEPLSCPHPVDYAGEYRHIQLDVEAIEWEAIRRFCRKNVITPAIFFRAVYGLLVRTMCRAEEDFVVNEVVSGRSKDYRQTFGCYYHQIPLVYEIEKMNANVRVDQYLTHMKSLLRSLKNMQYVSLFEQRKHQTESSIQFIYNYHLIDFPFPGRVILRRPPSGADQVQFLPEVQEGALQLNLYFHDGYFLGGGFLERLLDVSNQIVNGANYLGDLNYVTPSEHAKLLDWGAGICPLPPYKDAVVGFEDQVRRTPNAMAVEHGNIRISYQALNARANQLARYLLAQGVCSGDRVGIGLGLGVDLLVSVLAAYKVGAAYVPLDVRYPAQRLTFMAEQGQLRHLITAQQWSSLWQDTAVPISVIDHIEASLSNYAQTDLQGVERGGLAYIVFTSGSTGQPKGVGVEHHGVVNLLHWYGAEFGMGADDKHLVISSFGFDLTQKNLLAVLWRGGCVVFGEWEDYEPNRVAQLIEQAGITLLNCAPSMFYPLLEAKWYECLKSLRYVLLGGEPIALDRMRHWLGSELCRTELINLYGPTECTDIASFFRFTSVDLKYPTVSLGGPNWGMRLKVLDEALRMVPVGVVGELCIGGVGVSWGYINVADQTAERFVPDSFAGDGSRLYRTGDLVRYRPDGNLEYLGRMDDQVKVRGYRIELGEIEAVLGQCAGVAQAIAVIHKGEEDNHQLVAYIVWHSGEQGEFDTLRKALAEKLPAYMIPHAMVTLETIPLTPNGKIDRKALPDPQFQSDQQSYIAPRNPQEEELVGIFARILKLERVGVEDNFFALGGHSLLATQLISQIRDQFGIEIALRTVFEQPTVAGLAVEVIKAQQNEQNLKLPPLLRVPREGFWISSIPGMRCTTCQRHCGYPGNWMCRY